MLLWQRNSISLTQGLCIKSKDVSATKQLVEEVNLKGLIKMRAELSTLFHLSGQEWPVENAVIGSGVRIERLPNDWINQVKEECPKVKAREMLEHVPHYTHRFVCTLSNI
jgi:hypothetical protein